MTDLRSLSNEELDRKLSLYCRVRFRLLATRDTEQLSKVNAGIERVHAEQDRRSLLRRNEDSIRP